MTNYLEIKISTVTDEDFQVLISELCECLHWAKDEFRNKSLANLFTIIVTEERKLDLKNVLISRVLSTKIKNLAYNSVLASVCTELANRKGKAMDDMAGKSVFTLIKQCHMAVCPPKSRSRKSTRLQNLHQCEATLISRRR